MSKFVVVLGGGESGTGAAILAKVKGLNVFLSDAGTIPDKYKKCWINTMCLGKKTGIPSNAF